MQGDLARAQARLASQERRIAEERSRLRAERESSVATQASLRRLDQAQARVTSAKGNLRSVSGRTSRPSQTSKPNRRVSKRSWMRSTIWWVSYRGPGFDSAGVGVHQRSSETLPPEPSAPDSRVRADGVELPLAALLGLLEAMGLTLDGDDLRSRPNDTGSDMWTKSP